MALLELYRGDAKTYPAKVPTSIWTAGGKLMFAVKAAVDNVSDDTSAIIKKTLTDADITASDSKYKIYTLVLTSTDTDKNPGDYTGEFQYVDASGNATTYQQFTFRIAGDINRRTT